jgi:nucleoid-associated protein YgaU
VTNESLFANIERHALGSRGLDKARPPRRMASEGERIRMGLIDFVKEAGEKLLRRAHPGEAQASPTQPAEAGMTPYVPPPIDPDALAERINELGLRVQGLTLSVEDDIVIATGEAASQADCEKVVLALGNVVGVAGVDNRMSVKVPEPPAVFYTVVKGDNLSKIAKQHYGDANKYNSIFEANRPMLKHPDKIYPGQVLRIPPVS